MDQPTVNEHLLGEIHLSVVQGVRCLVHEDHGEALSAARGLDITHRENLVLVYILGKVEGQIQFYGRLVKDGLPERQKFAGIVQISAACRTHEGACAGSLLRVVEEEQ